MNNWQLLPIIAKEQRRDDLRRAEQYRLVRECKDDTGTVSRQPMAALLVGSFMVAILWQMA